MMSVWHIPEKEPPLVLFLRKSEWGSFTPGLDHVRRALSKIGMPQKAYQQVLIGGTNGKGSVALNLSLNLPGKTGCFLSPHVVDLRERILIDGQPVADELWQAAYLQINQYVSDDELSYFEWTFVIAAMIFAIEKVETAVFEVGVGGREDATNVLDPAVSCVVSVAMDHMAVLGDSLEAIALHKIGIGRAQRPLLLPCSIAILAEVQQALKQQQSHYEFHDYNGYQENQNVVLRLLQLLGHTKKLNKWQHPIGRRMSLDLKNARWYLDGAHNEAAWLNLRKWLDEQGLNRVPMICGLSIGRDPHKFIQIMRQHIEKLYVWHFNPERQVAPELWQEAAIEANIELCWMDSAALSRLSQQDCIMTGSLYLVGQALRALDSLS